MKKKSKHSAAVYLTTGLFQLVWGCVKYIPTPVGDLARWAVLRLTLKRCAIPVLWIRAGTDIWWPSNISIGESFLNESLFFNGYGGIEIGDHCLIGKGCSFFSGGHNFQSLDDPIAEQGLMMAPIHLEDDVYLGINCIVLGNVRIGRGAVVGAGSVVTRDVPPLAVVAGNPAKLIRYREHSSQSAADV